LNGLANKLQEALSEGRFLISQHAYKRMRQRKVLEYDLKGVGRSSHSIVRQDHGTWKVKGKDSYGNSLTVIVGVEEGVLNDEIIVVTVF
jgi:hypothetical protein